MFGDQIAEAIRSRPLPERIKQVRDILHRTWGHGKPGPRMSIPLRYEDEDLIVFETLRELQEIHDEKGGTDG